MTNARLACEIGPLAIDHAIGGTVEAADGDGLAQRVEVAVAATAGVGPVGDDDVVAVAGIADGRGDVRVFAGTFSTRPTSAGHIPCRGCWPLCITDHECAKIVPRGQAIRIHPHRHRRIVTDGRGRPNRSWCHLHPRTCPSDLQWECAEPGVAGLDGLLRRIWAAHGPANCSTIGKAESAGPPGTNS